MPKSPWTSASSGVDFSAALAAVDGAVNLHSRRFTLTAEGGEVAISTIQTIYEDSLEIFRDGLLLGESDYTQTSSRIATLTTSATAGQSLTVKYLSDESSALYPVWVVPLALSGAFTAGELGVPYLSEITISGGDGVYSNPRATSGSVPAGLSLSIVSPNKLRLSGTPTAAGTSSFFVAVDSGDSQTVTHSQSVTVTVIIDPYYSSVVFLSDFEELKSYDSVPAAVSAFGSAAISSNQHKVGLKSLFLSGGYVETTVALPAALSELTIEGWIYMTSSPSSCSAICSCWADDSTGSARLLISSSGALVFHHKTASGDIAIVSSASLSITIGQWIHIAVVKTSSELLLFIGGTFVSSTSVSAAIRASSDKMQIGRNEQEDTWRFAGYIDSLRVSKVARYGSSGFTPNTLPFPVS